MSGEELVKEIKAHVRETFDQISEEFDSTRYKPWPETIDFFKTLKPGSLVLDLGVGNGRNAVYAIRSGLSVIGVDLSNNMVNLARKKYDDTSKVDKQCWGEFIQSDLNVLPLKDNSVDAVLCVATIHHIPSGSERKKAMDELHRVLKPGGTAFISVWDLDQPRFKQELSRQLYGVCMAKAKNKSEGKAVCGTEHPPSFEFGDVWVPWQGKDGKTYFRFYHLFYHNELNELVQQSGFKLMKYFRRMDNHNAVVIKPKSQ